MSQEQIKVLEMVAAGKISPADGERLLNALRSDGRGGRMGFGPGEVRIPRIDLGQVGEMMVEIKKSIREGARAAKQQIREGRMREYVELRDFYLEQDPPSAPMPVELSLESQAGQLKLVGGAPEGKLLSCKSRRVKEPPTISLTEAGGRASLKLAHSLGIAKVSLSEAWEYSLKLDNSAADAQLDLSALRVSSIKAANNAGNLALRLGSLLPRVQLDLTNNAGSLSLALDPAFALRVAVSGTLSSANLERFGLTLVDGWLQSADWEGAAQRAEILLAQNVASFALSWRGTAQPAQAAPPGVLSAQASAAPAGSVSEAALADADRLAAEAQAAMREVESLSAQLRAGTPASPAAPQPPAPPQPPSPPGPAADLPSSDL